MQAHRHWHIRLLLVFISVTTLNAHHPQDFTIRLDRIAFGSCNRTTLPQPLWPIIQGHAPDLWIWAGDNVYGDSKQADVLAAEYTKQLELSAYRSFRTHTPIIGTWDDHDYGRNDAGAEFPIKAQSRDLALNFFGVPKTDPRWGRDGLYGSYTFGPTEHQVCILLLDCRYFAEGSDLLGPDQQHWLEASLRESKAQLNIIVSSIQVLPNEHRFEKWANFHTSHAWFLELVEALPQTNVLILSGDRHFHEISALQLGKHPTPLTEITSSGLTHAYTKFKGEPNQHRVGKVYAGIGFGLLTLDWTEHKLEVTSEIRDAEDGVRLRHQITYPLVSSIQ
ncbi:alkaline phosphatase D family protein [Coraliomargarita akajimensis]|uniref:Phosphodiesterase/alkaline phosphatase D-like protein n=1 Tax=Coraliomargarita akajimensis (strain DSM 45221 / IAM 15411 / JCM 23193 / KCTC 12865 / 04OKA010-24) TaxID=583355 RepID=D5EKP1_CORAD|nr:alkaline phosphatase D family protein [Coraliomargarita akajimensis]ADE54948.1 phosphodiesterase/alkaline phosphatase D-like protein [Coraliomargarita akajimensis DSM 45221]